MPMSLYLQMQDRSIPALRAGIRHMHHLRIEARPDLWSLNWFEECKGSWRRAEFSYYWNFHGSKTQSNRDTKILLKLVGIRDTIRDKFLYLEHFL